MKVRRVLVCFASCLPEKLGYAGGPVHVLEATQKWALISSLDCVPIEPSVPMQMLRMNSLVHRAC